MNKEDIIKQKKEEIKRILELAQIPVYEGGIRVEEAHEKVSLLGLEIKELKKKR